MLFFGEVEVEFEDYGAVTYEVLFEIVYVLVSVWPEVVAVVGWGKLLFGEDFGADFDDEDVFVVAAVEYADAASLGECFVVSPQKIVVEFFFGGGFEAFDLAALGVDAGHDVADGSVFSRGIHPLQNNQHRIRVACPKQLLHTNEFLLVSVKDSGGVLAEGLFVFFFCPFRNPPSVVVS